MKAGRMDKNFTNLQNINPPKNNNSETTNPTEINYWRGFSELYNDPEFNSDKKKEFSKEADKEFDATKLNGISRRRFLALMSASAAFAAAGCSDYRDKGEIIPYNKKPEEIILGLPNYYASTCTGCEQACGVLIKTREGRPIKIDGNPDHPVNKGKICTKGQAGILNLYEPSRLKEPLSSGTKTTWAEADEKIITALKKASASGKEISIVTHTVLSPSLKKLLDDFKAVYPTTKIYSYELINNSSRKSAWVKCYGKAALSVIQWDKAKIILALESDFLGNEGNVMEQTRLYATNRDILKSNEFNRLYAVEGGMSLTGINADYRLRLRTDAIEELAMCLLSEFLVKKKISKYTNEGVITSKLSPFSLNEFVKKYQLNEKTIKSLVGDLEKNQGSAYVSCGEKLPESTHIAVNLLNEVLGNTKLYSVESERTDTLPLSTKSELDKFVSEMSSGKVGVLIHFDTNPVFHFAPDYNYSEAIKKVSTVVSITETENETSAVSNYTLPASNYLECWGDFKMRTGFYSLQQPVIANLYQNRQKEAMLLTWIKGTKDFYNDKIYQEFIIANWEKNIYPQFNTTVSNFRKFWFSILHDGVAYVNEKVDINFSFLPASFIDSGKVKASNDFVLLLDSNNTIGDGRFANNGWLQELPNPVTKIVWDNYAAISLQTANELGLKSNDTIEITSGGRKQTVPVFIQPGIADKVLQIALGYGRTKAGEVGNNVGVNMNLMMTKNPLSSDYFYNDVKVSRTNGSYELISTQEHFPLDDNPMLKDIHKRRFIIQEGTLAEYSKEPKFLKEKRGELELTPINNVHEYNQVKWTMSIDLNKCTGCGACVTACNVENNIPVVGKDQVKVNREMHWIRLDRYYSGTPDSPRASLQPMLCQHCDFAPCENVCPVAATTHSNDGVNTMAYNRCVGTRYCSNNCPYKVRRYNYFDYRERLANSFYENEPINMMYNPEVTVRDRGVMEKCSFCLQRIMDERQNAIRDKRKIVGSNVKTACQDSCPANAIVFGDANDKESEIAKYREHNLGYFVLEEIKVAPNVTYVAKLRNVEKED